MSKITVLNGSPKGKTSVTMQYVHFIQKKFPQHELKILHISQRIKKIERDEGAFQEVIEQVRASDGVLWAFPLYVFLVPANYKRFVELISEKSAQDAFADKYTAVLTTSIHFFDHTAHNYMHAVCDDLDMRFAGSFSADMHDLLKEEERNRLLLFADGFFEAIENRLPTSRSYMPITQRDFAYAPGDASPQIDPGDKRVLIVTDAQAHQSNLRGMVQGFGASFAGEIETINLRELDIKGSCLGCLQCGYDNRCVYEDEDDYVAFYNTKVKTADMLLFAGTIQDRYLSSKWKTFFDRSFFNGHAPSLIGKQIGFIISGSLSQVPNLRQVLEAWVELQHANLVGFVTDEFGNSAEIDALLHDFAGRFVRFARSGYIRPPTFLSVGGQKLFRDAIWGSLRPVFQADHRVYRELGVYDFPQKDYRTRITNGIMTLLLKAPGFRKEFNKRIRVGMVQPFQKVLEN